MRFVKVINSNTNQKLKLVRALLASKKARDENGLYVIESPKVIYSLIPEQVEYILVNPEGKEKLGGLANIPVYEVEDSLFKTLSDTETPRGIIAVVKKPNPPDLAILKETLHETIVILDGIQDPGNAGTIIRTAAAFNCAAVLYTERTVDLYSPKVVRSSAGAILEVPLLPIRSRKRGPQTSPVPFLGIAELKAMGFSIVITVSNQHATDLKIHDAGKWHPEGKQAVVFSNEGSGVSAELAAAADQAVTIYHSESAESLNVAVSAGIILEKIYAKVK
ncbi:MAG: RNA methyltransferase [Candidatus Margulisiibacteriota bacterium]